MADRSISKHQTGSADERSSKSCAGRSTQKCSSIHFEHSALLKARVSPSCVLQMKTEIAGYRRSSCYSETLRPSWLC